MRCLRLFVCSQCSHFCRFTAKTTKIRAVLAKNTKTRAFFCKNHKNSCLFRQKPQKFVPFSAKTTKTRAYFSKNFSMSQKSCVWASKVRVRTARSMHFWRKCERILLDWRVFGENADAFCSLGAFLGKVRAHFAFMACFRGKCGRILFRRHDFGESALAHFASSQRDALLTTFCLLAPLAFCRKAEPCLTSFPAENSCLLRQKTQKFAARFWAFRACARLAWRDFVESACARGGQRRVLGESARSLWRLEQKL